MKSSSYLFLGESIAASVLADLVAFLVSARSAVSTVVFPLATRTFPAPLSLFLRRLLVGVCVLAPAEQVRVNINNVTMITITITTAITIISTEANLLRSEVRKFKPGESEPLPEGSAGGLNAAARPGEGGSCKGDNIGMIKTSENVIRVIKKVVPVLSNITCYRVWSWVGGRYRSNLAGGVRQAWV